MRFEPALAPAVLIRRYKRFLADVMTDRGEVMTVHCPNTGSLRGCLEANARVWISDSGNARRKYRHTLELVTTPAGDIACINTARANNLVRDAIAAGLIPELASPLAIKAEVGLGSGRQRFDFAVTTARDLWYVEVKNVTLKEGPLGYFPDSVTERGARQLRELGRLARAGGKAMLVYCVANSGIEKVAAAAHIDPAYSRELDRALAEGMHCVALKARVTPELVVLERQLPVGVTRIGQAKSNPRAG